jgi:hypothetical protein
MGRSLSSAQATRPAEIDIRGVFVPAVSGFIPCITRLANCLAPAKSWSEATRRNNGREKRMNFGIRVLICSAALTFALSEPLSLAAEAPRVIRRGPISPWRPSRPSRREY